MGRGGKRVGTAGRSYSNRSDLNRVRTPSAPKVAPADPSQPYGTQAAQVRSLAALPLPNAASSQPSASAGSGAPSIQALLAAAGHGGIPEGQPLTSPTNRPDEPLTTGIPTGPGAGPEVLPQAPPGPDTDVRDFISTLASVNPSPELAQLADYVASNRG